MSESPVSLAQILTAILHDKFDYMEAAEREDSPGLEGVGYTAEINGVSIGLDLLGDRAVIQVFAEDGECFQTELTLSPMEAL